jgi:hypothetical protein
MLAHIHGFLPPQSQNAMRQVSSQMYPLPIGEFPPFYGWLFRRIRGGTWTYLKVVAKDLSTGALFIASFGDIRSAGNAFAVTNLITVDSVATADFVLTKHHYTKSPSRTTASGLRIYSVWRYGNVALGYTPRDLAGGIRQTLTLVQQHDPVAAATLVTPIDPWDPEYSAT